MNFNLSLTEYSAKYKVSVSTLRRRIKKDEIPFNKREGKYLLPDMDFDNLQDMDNGDVAPPATASSTTKLASNVASPQQVDLNSAGLFVEDIHRKSFSQESQNDLKKAYAQILNEKEEQILHLKQHIVDLQTLNKALENEIERLSEESSDFDFPKTSFTKHTF